MAKSKKPVKKAKTHTCPNCGKKYASRSTLESHLNAYGCPKAPFAKKPARPARTRSARSAVDPGPATEDARKTEKPAQPKIKGETFQPSDWSQARKGTKRSKAQHPLSGATVKPRGGKKRPAGTPSAVPAAVPPAEPREMLVCDNCDHQFEDGGPESVTVGDPCPVCQDRNDEGVLKLREVSPTGRMVEPFSPPLHSLPREKTNLVQVAFNGGKRYTYDAGALDLKAGDMVEVQLGYGNRIVRVEQLGSDYIGPTKSVIRKVEDEKSPDPSMTQLRTGSGQTKTSEDEKRADPQNDPSPTATDGSDGSARRHLSPTNLRNSPAKTLAGATSQAISLVGNGKTMSQESVDRPASGLAAHLASRLIPSVALSSDTAPHLIVEARAGTGKTFTLIVGVINMFRNLVIDQ